MSRNLIAYVNCSKGGVTSVIRGRAIANPGDVFDAIFALDKGGTNAFSDLPNVNVRIVPRNQMVNFIHYLLGKYDYQEVSILSMPEIAENLDTGDDVPLVYEIHTSDFEITTRELEQLDVRKIDEFRVPSEYSAFNVKNLLNRRVAPRVRVVPNLIDTRYFARTGNATEIPSDITPLVWIGRFDGGKGAQYLCRLLARLPERFVAYIVVSLESAPDRMTKVLAEANALNVAHRIEFRLNLPQNEIADLMRGVRDHNGYYVSTSMMESFGYAIAEATACGLRVAAFDLPVLPEHPEYENLIETAEPGNILGLAEIILRNS